MPQSPARKRKKKRKVNIKNLMIVIISVVLVLCALIGIPLYHYQKTQKARHELLAEKLEARKEYESVITQTSYSGEDEEIRSSVETIKKWALEENKDQYAQLEALSDQKITKEQEEEIKALETTPNEQAYTTILTRVNEIDPYWIRFLGKDQDRLTFVGEYFNQDAFQNPPAELSESISSVPALLQWDQRWGYIPYGDMIIAFSGCAPTSISMAASYLNQDPSITPSAVAKFAEEAGDYVIGAGTAYSIFDHAAEKYDLMLEGVPVDLDSISEALDKDKVLIAHAVPGKFTTVGHFMVITDVEDGKIIVHDPNSIKNTNTKWDPEEMLPEFDFIWAYSKA